MICLDNKVAENVVGKPRFKISDYEDMEIIASVDEDYYGRPMSHFTSIASLPQSNRVAVLHNQKRITLISSSAKLLGTFEGTMPLSNCHSLIGHTDRDMIFFADRCDIMSATWHDDGNNSFQAIRRVPFCSTTIPWGLAFSPSSAQIFTATARQIVSFSTHNWAQNYAVNFASPDQIGTSSVLGFVKRAPRDEWLFFTSKYGHTLNAAPVDPKTGRLTMKNASIIADDFLDIRGLASDEDGNFLVADARRNRVEVFTRNWEPVCAFGRPKATHFSPAGVTFLKSPDDTMQKRRLIVTPDLETGRIFFFS